MYLFKIASCRSVTTPCIAATFFTLWLTYWPVDKILEIVECIFPNWISYLYKIALCGSYIAATFFTWHIGQDLRKNPWLKFWTFLKVVLGIWLLFLKRINLFCCFRVFFIPDWIRNLSVVQIWMHPTVFKYHFMSLSTPQEFSLK